MTKKNKSFFKAIAFVMVGTIAALVAVGAILGLWFGNFFPVYVAGKLVIWRKIVRWGMYAVAIVAMIAGFALIAQGTDYIERRLNKKRRL